MENETSVEQWLKPRRMLIAKRHNVALKGNIQELMTVMLVMEVKDQPGDQFLLLQPKKKFGWNHSS